MNRFIENVFKKEYFKLNPNFWSPDENSLVARTAVCALEVLNLNKTASNGFSFATDFCSIGSRLVEIYQTGRCQGNQALQVAFAVMRVALPLINSSFGAVLMPGIETVKSVVLFARNRSLENFGQILLNSTFLALTLSGTPYLYLASMLFKAVFSLHQAYLEYQKGHNLEAVVKALCGLARLYQANPQLQDFYYDCFGKKITETEWSGLVGALQQDQTVNVRTLLLKNKFTTRLSGLKFLDLSKYFFENLSLKECSFEGEFNSLTFKRVHAASCSFSGAVFNQSLIQSSRFSNCSFWNFSFISSKMEDSSFFDSDVRASLWFGSMLRTTSFTRSLFAEANFLRASVSRCSLKDCVLIDALFCDAMGSFKMSGRTSNTLTKPVVGLSWNLAKRNGFFTKLIFQALRENGMIPLRFPMYMEELDSGELDSQVRETLEEISKNPSKNMLSISDEILRRAPHGTPLARVQSEVRSFLLHCDGVALPGSMEDLHPELYGASLQEGTVHEPSYMREMIELSTIKIAKELGLPVMGTCRGAQLLNIFFGGTQTQYIAGQNRAYFNMPLQNSPYAEELKKLAGSRWIELLSMHHQAIDKVGFGFDVVLKNKAGVPKLLISRDGNLIATQAHPENYQTDLNRLENASSEYSDRLKKRIRGQLAVYKLFYTRVVEAKKQKKGLPQVVT